MELSVLLLSAKKLLKKNLHYGNVTFIKSLLIVIIWAGVAQLVEQRFCKPPVVGSIPIASSSFFPGEIPEWSKGSDCKSDGVCLRRFESFSRHHPRAVIRG